MSEFRSVTIRPMQAEDAPAVAEMARELAAAVDDPEPILDANDLVRDGTGAERWFDCLVAVTAAGVVGYAMTCRGYEAHIGKRRLWLSDLFVRKQARRRGVGRALMIAVGTAVLNARRAGQWRQTPVWVKAANTNSEIGTTLSRARTRARGKGAGLIEI